MLLLVLACTQLMQAGCRSAPKTAFEVVSPTREYNAEVQMFDNGGRISPGVNVTYISMHRGTDPELPILILSGGPPQVPPVVRWVTPTLLSITYNEQQLITFQAVQFDNVAIAVTNAGKTSTARW